MHFTYWITHTRNSVVGGIVRSFRRLALFDSVQQRMSCFRLRCRADSFWGDTQKNKGSIHSSTISYSPVFSTHIICITEWGFTTYLHICLDLYIYSDALTAHFIQVSLQIYLEDWMNITTTQSEQNIRRLDVPWNSCDHKNILIDHLQAKKNIASRNSKEKRKKNWSIVKQKNSYISYFYRIIKYVTYLFFIRIYLWKDYYHSWLL